MATRKEAARTRRARISYKKWLERKAWHAARVQHDAHVQAFKATLNDEQWVRRDGYVTNYSEEPHHG